jgi:hypothetical protein
MSWDVVAAYYAAFGIGDHFFALSAPGKNVIDTTDGHNTWTSKASGNARYIVKNASDNQIGAAMSDLFIQSPRSHGHR